MKKTFLLLSLMVGITVFVLTEKAKATIWVIDVQNFSFSPSALTTVTVGDTVRWVWIEGSHTTTSTTIPGSAASWDHPMNSTSTQFDYVPTVSGVYNYKCTPHASLGMVGSFTVMGGVGLEEVAARQELNVSPNPFTNNFVVGFVNGSDQRIKEVHLYDLSGQQVMKVNDPDAMAGGKILLNPGELERGIYFLKVVDQANKIFMQRIIKK